ncbi:site-2 protease family protein [Candidatus Saccharibacteria bacterium]|nr:site-2 protease family protein [Candidatus Saccharibacteria bacterium]
MDFDVTYVVMVLVAVFASMVLHELMHGLTAYWLGDATAKENGRLSLNPIRHIDPFLTILLPVMLAIFHMPIFGGAKPVPFRPDRVKGGEWGAALVGIAGPLTNLVLAFGCFGALVLFGTAGFVGQFLFVAVMVNLGFFAFNILPIPPLDGSRVLYAIAPEGVRRAMEFIEQMGLIIIFVIVLILSKPLGIVLGAIINFILKIFAAIFGVQLV